MLASGSLDGASVGGGVRPAGADAARAHWPCRRVGEPVGGVLASGSGGEMIAVGRVADAVGQ